MHITTKAIRLVAAGAALALLPLASAQAQQMSKASEMTFFVTSVGSGKGGDLGGLAGADKQCQALAQAAGAGNKTWRAYLSTQAEGGQPAVNARDRIGAGPWQNAMGVVVARTLADLHDGNNNLSRFTALSEKGMRINGRGDQPNTHDILTGSQPNGMAYAAGEDMTCGNWTRSGAEGGAMLGHHDREGLDETIPARSWNTSHRSRGGCSVDALRSSGGAGLFYCFAAN
ncbi:MAG TPA: hypothetical protein VFS04_10845 [Alphaproteobacteria bacterium]|nr:hypothetical protein [Alphaproteobacteria bacterium]